MGIKIIKQSSISILIVALFMLWYVVPSIAQGPGPSARGSAIHYNVFGEPITNSFNVRIDRDGLARGQWESHRPLPSNDNLVNHAALNCLYVDGNMASIGAVVTHSNEAGFEVGTQFIFVVLDNGEGKNAAPDEVSNVCLGFGSDCADMDAIDFCTTTLNEIIRGNVQVNP